MIAASDLFAFPSSLADFASAFDGDQSPWEWLSQIGPAVTAVVAETPGLGDREIPAGVKIEGPVWIAPDVELPAYATLIGPAWIGPSTEIRPGAFLRGKVIVGAGCVLGNACEYKNCLLMDGVQTPHYNYVGDSILGNRAHLGAGAICANLRLDQQPVAIKRSSGERIDTGLRKVGAFLGDGAEAGCNSVLQPGTILHRRAAIGPAMSFGGELAADTIAVDRSTPVFLKR